jgi:hypothetical protein
VDGQAYGVTFLRISVGIVFFWFGFLKYFPGLSPATDLAITTIDMLTFGIITGQVALVYPCNLGSGNRYRHDVRHIFAETIFLLFFQMLGTVSPLFLLPGKHLRYFPSDLTLEGQYIIKNIVIVSAAIVVGATVRGGRLIADPEKIRKKYE